VKYWTPSAGGLSSRGTLRFTSATRDEMVDRTETDNCRPIRCRTSTQTTQASGSGSTDPSGSGPTGPSGSGPTDPRGPGPTGPDSSSSRNNNDSGGSGGGGSVHWIDPGGSRGGTFASSGFGLRYDRFRSERPKPRYLLPLSWTLDTQL
jgi:hypothetical protein